MINPVKSAVNMGVLVLRGIFQAGAKYHEYCRKKSDATLTAEDFEPLGGQEGLDVYRSAETGGPLRILDRKL